jgi:hypothetical protein
LTDVVVKTIGAVGRNYATIAAWEADTDDNLQVADELRVGECYDDSVFGEAVSLSGATTDAGRFRVLQAATGEDFDPISGSGVRIATTAAAVVLAADEAFTVWRHLGAESLTTGSSQSCFLASGTGPILAEKCVALAFFATVRVGTGGFQYTAGGVLRRCIAVGPNDSGASVGNPYGFVASSLTQNIVNCAVFGASFSPGGGFARVSSSTMSIWNSVAASNPSGSDYSSISFQSHNASSDATAAGAESLTNQPASRLFRDVLNHDFRPFRHSPHVDAGVYVPPRKPFLFERVLIVDHASALSADLVLALPFVEGFGIDVIDLSAPGNDGTLVGTPPWSRSLPGTTVVFDGTTDQLDVPYLALLEGGDCTISMWVNVDTTPGNDCIFAESNEGSGNSRFYIWTNSVSGSLDVYIQNEGATGTLTLPGTAVVDDGWHHVVVVNDGDTIALYIDGVLDAGPTAWNRAANGGHIFDGTAFMGTPGNARRAIGSLADARCWTRALSAAEVLALYEHPWAQYGADDETDFAGQTVPRGAAPSIGAYEEEALPVGPKSEVEPLPWFDVILEGVARR